MKTKTLLLIPLILACVFSSCSKDDKDTNPIPDDEVIAATNGTDLTTFEIINQCGLPVKSIHMLPGFYCSKISITQQELDKIEQTLNEKEYIEDAKVSNSSEIELTLVNMHKKEYQEDWKTVRAELELEKSFYNDYPYLVEIVFQVNPDTRESWIERLKENTKILNAYIPPTFVEQYKNKTKS